MISVNQCRAGRALLDWTAQKLADEAGVGVATVRRYEAGSTIAAGSLIALEQALSRSGVTFIPAGEASQSGGEGVRLDQGASGGRA